MNQKDKAAFEALKKEVEELRKQLLVVATRPTFPVVVYPQPYYIPVYPSLNQTPTPVWQYDATSVTYTGTATDHSISCFTVTNQVEVTQ